MSDERRDDEGRDEPAGPSEEEEKGLGLTEEFARLEQEIRREVGGEGDGPVRRGGARRRRARCR